MAVGGTARNLAAAAQLAAGMPSYGIQGYRVTRDALGALIERFSSGPPAEVPGIKAARADLILAGALVIDGVMEAGGFDAFEATEAGLREGVFFERLYPEGVSSDVRRDAVRNLASQYDTDFAHSEHVARLALEIWDALRAHGLHDGDAEERELVWATAMLHDIGVAVDYDDHHKHSRYLILNAGLPGFSPRETALIGQAARYHRKGTPSLGEFAPEMRDGDRGALDRIAACVRLAEQLERSRDQSIHTCEVAVHDGTAELHLQASGDTRIARWAAERQADLFKRAFARDLVVT